MDQKYYYLFGETAANWYLNNNWDTFITLLKEKPDFELYTYDEAVDFPGDLLDAFNGWMGYAQINEFEYDILKAIQSEL